MVQDRATYCFASTVLVCYDINASRGEKTDNGCHAMHEMRHAAAPCNRA